MPEGRAASSSGSSEAPLSDQRLNCDSVTQSGNAQRAVDQQQAFEIVLAVDIRRFQQQRGRASAAHLMKQRGRVVAIGRLAGQQFEMMVLAVCILVFSFILFKKKPAE